ncbi:hypothetical protein [Spartinivicinus poritis]|uniref:Uncharacterized protein n=1 Tax=Spartinivicinus poritis TaxID=2994640 RepID=A0ABT5UCI9_9GAMM|nr:hypothetical protein [Spartinivicinus sp. A2-2]MDE1463711.1 hypothetical protein [Spartinivicinus sp. A2-2]
MWKSIIFIAAVTFSIAGQAGDDDDYCECWGVICECGMSSAK